MTPEYYVRELFWEMVRRLAETASQYDKLKEEHDKCGQPEAK